MPSAIRMLAVLLALPLAMASAPRVDTSTGESSPGDFLFNPYTGATLQTAPQPSKPTRK